MSQIMDKLNIARGATMCPIGKKPYKDDVMYSIPPDSNTLSSINSAIMNCCKVLGLLSSERVEGNTKYFHKKYLYMVESNTLGTYDEAKREISCEISTIMGNKSLYAIETAICCLEGILLIFSDIPKKKIQIGSDVKMLEELQDTLYEVPIEQFQINSKKIREIEKSINILEYYESFESNYSDFIRFAFDKFNEMINRILL